MEKGKKKKIREMDSLYSLPKTPEGKKERRKEGKGTEYFHSFLK